MLAVLATLQLRCLQGDLVLGPPPANKPFQLAISHSGFGVIGFLSLEVSLDGKVSVLFRIVSVYAGEI